MTQAQQQPIVLAFLGGSTGLAGLTLVFLGLVISSYQAHGKPPPVSIRPAYRRLTSFVLASFVCSLACTGVSTFWLIRSGGSALYTATEWTFVAQLPLLLFATSAVLKRVMGWKWR